MADVRRDCIVRISCARPSLVVGGPSSRLQVVVQSDAAVAEDDVILVGTGEAATFARCAGGRSDRFEIDVRPAEREGWHFFSVVIRGRGDVLWRFRSPRLTRRDRGKHSCA